MTTGPKSVEHGEEPRRSPSHWTLANGLTTLRFVLAPINAALVAAGNDVAAAGVFVLAVATDLADGPLARRRGGMSSYGSLLDHGSDAIFVTLGLGALASRGLVPPVLPPLIILAFAQYTVDSQALVGKRLRASFLGRWNGIFYFVLLGTPLIRNAIGLSHPSDAMILMLGWLLILSTGASMVDRLIALRRSRKA
jgi:CDP-diacylglycerol--glycerol-3-phosphate 3-phosphatidyltransferase